MAAQDLFESALAAEGVTGTLADLARSIYVQESGAGKNTKTSNAGAVGGMQIIPGTFKEVADKDWSIDDPMHNARAGIRYLKKLDKIAGGDPKLTAVGYYGGPGGIEKAKKGEAVRDPRNPNAPDTLQYGDQVVSRLSGFGKPVRSTPQQPTAAAPVVASVPTGEAAPPAAVAASVLGESSGPVILGSAGGAGGSDPWQAFLATVARSSPKAIQPSDLSFGVMPMSIRPSVRGRAAPSVMPNFAAFQAWKGRA